MCRKKTYYAIKIGNGVKDKIVPTWEECKKYVIGYPSVYKGFKDKKEAEKYLKNLTSEQIEIELKWNEIHRFYRLKEKWEMDCNFKIPNYIVDEIINGNNYNNLCSLLSLAVENNRLSNKQASIIKEKCKKK